MGRRLQRLTSAADIGAKPLVFDMVSSLMAVRFWGAFA
jgi:hypothetical protein